MKKEEMLNHLKAFDPAIFTLLQDEIQRQRCTLSLIPTVNAMSPLAAFLEGSALANSTLEGCGARHASSVEELVRTRAQELFGSAHAVVRLGNIAAASRVTFLALLQPGDTVLSFNRRKEEHCAGLNYHFENFGIDPALQKVDWDEVMQLAERVRPRLIIFSPVSYPCVPNYERLAAVARAVGAYLWVDIGQCVGLVAAGLIPSPVALADVVSFPTNDSLRGPDGAILLCTKELAPQMDAAVANTGHISLHMNHLAALGFALHAAAQPRFRAYGEQVLANSRALAAALKEQGINLLAGGTETHLILAAPAAGVDIVDTVHALGRMGIYVKRDKIPTMRPEIMLSALRLSTLNPTTRGLKEADMSIIADVLARTLSGQCPAEEEDSVCMKIAKLLMDKPTFSEEWMNEGATAQTVAPTSDTGSVHEHVANERKTILKSLFK
ncbi:serine hydroxymethyltransferase [Selenomonas sp. oral taxon 138]|uniref:serine hydroxymethyltransferase n=1 Tax=Selenomonas sp. oral taxon 138 TaxID=712532 RepID=UPI00056955C9|nr:serine hydroxymethyltransferase [Selenomonas sp. oral taxon 138]